jgi:adenylosuccinate lyase
MGEASTKPPAANKNIFITKLRMQLKLQTVITAPVHRVNASHPVRVARPVALLALPVPASEGDMIPRYSRPAMAAIWAAENRYRIWFEIEAHALDAMARIGTVPETAAQSVWAWWKTGPAINVDRIDAIEAVTKHDVIAFLTWVSENVGEDARFLHQGMTSSDVLDTCLAVQLAQAADILIADLDALLAVIKRRAFEHKMTPTIGRSHGIHAEPVTFGLKLAQAYAEFSRNRDRLIAARADVATCAISGAVGTFANIDPAVEAHVADKMGLSIEPVSTQVIPRDRHAMFFATLGVIASSVERLAIEIRHLQRTEVLEAEEYFSPGQKGSSAMPHKRNPVLTENLTGLARMVRGYVTPALENVALWHERDISHSSVERYIGPDACITLDFALARLTGVVDKLLIYPERMQKNLDRMGGLVHSQRVLLALTQAGASREDAYMLVQRNAMKVWESDGALSLETLLKNDPDVVRWLNADAIADKFDLGFHYKHVDTIFDRVFGPIGA